MHLVLSRKSLVGIFGSLLGAIGLLNKREDRLIEAAKAGNREAFETLQLLHESAVKRFVFRRISGAEQDDVLQETWLAAWESLRLFDDRGKFRAWLLTIAFRRIQDFLRREHVRPKLSIYSDGVESAYYQTEFQGIELRQAMSGFWNACKPEQREMLTMYYADGLTLAEISRITCRNLNTVKYQFYKIHEEAVKMLPEQSEMLLAREVIA